MQRTAREGRLRIGTAEIYYRDIGHGTPVVVIHGGPDLDLLYLLPDLDRLADSCRLIYYAQRGRGASSNNVRPEDVTLDSEIEDLDRLRAFVREISRPKWSTTESTTVRRSGIRSSSTGWFNACA